MGNFWAKLQLGPQISDTRLMYVLAVLDRKRRLLTGDILPSLSNSLLLLSSNIALDVYHKKTESWKDIDVRLFHTQLSAPSHIFFSTDNIGYVCIFLWWPKPIIDYHYWQWSVEEKNIYSLQKYIGFVRWNVSTKTLTNFGIWKPIYFVSNSGKKSSNEKKEKNTHSFIIQKYI